MRTSNLASISACLVVAAVSVGCGGSGPVPIKPTFSVNGEPLSMASVSFVREGSEKGRAAFGMTDDAGQATLTTYKPMDGVLPGNYRVVVIKAPENPRTFENTEDMQNEDVASMSAMRDFRQAGPPAAKRVRSLLPDVYTDPGTTPLTCTVSYGMDNPEFQIDDSL